MDATALVPSTEGDRPAPSQIGAGDPRTGDRWPPTPYKGLNYYTAADAPLFGEREAEVEGCAELIGQFTTRILLLHGRSGTGKSSFLRAGLIPRLELERPGFHFLRKGGTEHPDPVLIRCTDDPVGRMHHVLARALRVDPVLGRIAAAGRAKAEQALQGGVDRDRMEMAEAVVEALVALTEALPQTLVLVIDQSEEVLTLQTRRDPRRRRQAFFHLLEELCLRNLDIRTIVALRTEYYGQFCDSFRINPTLTVTATARAGLEQFMLHGLGDADRIAAAIRRPTLTEAIGSYGSPRDRYRFSYDPGVPEQIAHDLLEHCGESSTLPVLQIVCNDLYNQVVVRSGRDVIAMADYQALGRVQGQVDAYIDHTIRNVLEETASGPVDDALVNQWRKLLSTLVGRQEGGAVTTMIRTERKLVDMAEQQGIGGDVRQLLGRFAGIECRLLRSMTIVADGPADERRGYSLGHDAIAVALFQWLEGHEKLERARRAAEERIRKERARTRRQRRIVRYGAAAVAFVFLLIGAELLSRAFDDRKEQVVRLNLFAKTDASSDFRLRLLLLLSSLSYSDGLWGRLGLISGDEAREALVQSVLQSPRYGGSYAAAGLDDTGSRVALLGPGGGVSVQDLRTGTTDRIGALRDAPGVPGMPRRAAAGFVAGLDRPVIYRAGVISHWQGETLTETSLNLFLSDDPERLPGLPWATMEIGPGAIRLPYWTNTMLGGTSLTVLVLHWRHGQDSAAARFEREERSLVPSDPTVRTQPVFSADSTYFARIEPTAGRRDFDVFVAKLAAPARGGRVAVRRQRLAGAAEPGLDGRRAFMSSDGSDAADLDAGRQRVVAFSDNGHALVVRDGAQTLRVFSIAENGDSQIALSEVLTVDIPDDMQSFAQPSWSQRPLLAAVRLGPVWRFAWVDAGGRAAVLDSGPASGPPSLRTFLSGANGARELDFSKDGRFLILQHYASPGLHVRVWDLDDARASEVAAMDMARLRAEACRIAAFESNRLSDTEKITWTHPNAPQPCGEK